jgi:hypothetical protein
MKTRRLVLALCGAVALIGAPGTTIAFETQGAGDPIDGASLLATPQSLLPDAKNHSLALPMSGKSDSVDAPFVSSYGNSIPIPGPGIDQPAPAWASTPAAMRLQ